LYGDPGSETVTEPISVPVLAPDSGFSVVLYCKQGSADVPPIWPEAC